MPPNSVTLNEEEGDNFDTTLNKLSAVKVHDVVFPTLMLMEIIDNFAEQGCRTSRFLTREELSSVKPNFPQSRMNFIFKHNIPLEVEVGIGKLLVDKFNELDWESSIDRFHIPDQSVQNKLVQFMKSLN